MKVYYERVYDVVGSDIIHCIRHEGSNVESVDVSKAFYNKLKVEQLTGRRYENK